MTYRMALAVVALIDAIVALYLHLWKLGLAGTLSCGPERGCEVVQLSSYGWFLGVDVALIGAVGWGTVFVVAVLGTLPRWEDARWPALALAALVYPALLFTLRLKACLLLLLVMAWLLLLFCPFLILLLLFHSHLILLPM